MINIYVGNLSYQATDQELRDMFASHGEVGNVTINEARPREERPRRDRFGGGRSFGGGGNW